MLTSVCYPQLDSSRCQVTYWKWSQWNCSRIWKGFRWLQGRSNL